MERECASCCSGDPGTARSMQGQGASSLDVAAAGTGESLSSCPSQPPQFASVALISMLTHPSSSMQRTNPCAGVNPVRSTSARQSQAERRWGRDNVTRAGIVGASAQREVALEPVAGWRRMARNRAYAGYAPGRGKLAGMQGAMGIGLKHDPPPVTTVGVRADRMIVC